MTEKFSIAVIWSLATAVLTKLASSWNMLPDQVVTTLGLGSEATGWGTREALLSSVLLVVVGQAILGTVLILRLARAVRFLPLVQACVSMVLVCGFWQVINYNTYHIKVQSIWVVGPVAILMAAVAVMLGNMASLGTEKVAFTGAARLQK